MHAGIKTSTIRLDKQPADNCAVCSYYAAYHIAGNGAVS